MENKNWIRTIEGQYSNKSPVGFCKYRKHPGVITKHQLEAHNCDLKNCSYFVKYKEHPYWDKTKSNLQHKAKRKKQFEKKSRKIFY